MKPRLSRTAFLTKALSKAQTRELIRWLTVENLTYIAAAQRLEACYGLKATISQLGKFWQRHCEPRRSVPAWNGQPIALDLRIYRRGTAFEFRILNRQPGVRVFIEGKKLIPASSRHLA